MAYIQNYPLLPALPKIADHTQLPDGAVKLGEVREGPREYRDETYTLVKRGKHLSILKSVKMPPEIEPDGYCNSYDFPIEFIRWFPKALHGYLTPPAEGGPHVGAMCSRDQNVAGEMLCITNNVDGYSAVNWSRQSPHAIDEEYEPTDLALTYNVLYKQGFMALLEELGKDDSLFE